MKALLHRYSVELLTLWLALSITACDVGMRRSEVDGEAVGGTSHLLAKLESTRELDLAALRALRGMAAGSICQLPPVCAQGNEEACPRIAAVRNSSLLAYVQNFLGNSENLELMIARVAGIKFQIKDEVFKTNDPSPRLAITPLSDMGPVTFSAKMLAPNGSFIAQGLIASAIVHEASHKIAPFQDDAESMLLPGAPPQSVEAWRVFDAIGDCVYARHLNLSAPASGGMAALAPFFRRWSGFLTIVSNTTAETNAIEPAGGPYYSMDFQLSATSLPNIVFRVSRAGQVQAASTMLRMAANLEAGGSEMVVSRRSWQDLGGAPGFDDIQLARVANDVALAVIRTTGGGMQYARLKVSSGLGAGATVVTGSFAALPSAFVTSAPPALASPAAGSNEVQLYFLANDGHINRATYNLDQNTWSPTATFVANGFSPNLGIAAVRDGNGAVSLIAGDADENLVVIQQTGSTWSDKQVLAAHDSVFATSRQPAAVALSGNVVVLFIVNSLGEPLMLIRDGVYQWESFRSLPGIPISLTEPLGVSNLGDEVLLSAKSNRFQYLGRGSY